MYVQLNLNMHMKSKHNVKIIVYRRKCFLIKKNFFAFRGSVKYFELASLELGRSSDG